MAKVKPVNKKKMTKASLAALIVTIAILLGLVLSLVASSGLFVRIQDGASSENYEINGSQLSYFTNAVYQNWYSQYYMYLYLGYYKLDTSKPLSEQDTANGYKAPTGETWYDYFVGLAKDQVEKILKYCEAARVDKEVNFSEMEAEAEQYAKDSIKALKESARNNNTDFITFIRQNFGQYVNEKDLHDALVLEHIASEYSNIMYDRIYDGMDNDRKDKYFADNLSSYISAEYLTFSLSQTVTPETVDEKAFEGGKDSQEYKDAVAAAEAAAKLQNELNKALDREFMEKLAAATSVDEFKKLVLERKYEETFKKVYDDAVKSWTADDKPAEDVLNSFRDGIKEAVIAAVIEGKDDIVEAEPTTEENTTESKWEKATKTLPKSLITSLKTVASNTESSGTYTLDTNVGKWLFAGVKAQYGIEYKEGETQGENAPVGDYFIDDKTMTEAEQAKGNYTLTVYYVTESAHRDEQVLRDVGHILFKVDTSAKENTKNTFKTSDEAKAAAEKLLEEIKTKLDGITDDEKLREEFEKFGTEYTADSNVFYDDVNKGEMQEGFENWLFEATTVGQLGLAETSYGWHIMLYLGETDEAWRVSAHTYATSEDLTEWYEALEYKVTINTNLFKTIFG